jgi:hypothetical protein
VEKAGIYIYTTIIMIKIFINLLTMWPDDDDEEFLCYNFSGNCWPD